MVLTSYPVIVSRLEELLSIEQYGVRGVLAGGRLLVPSFREGAINLYSYDPSKGSLTRLNRGKVNLYAEPPYWGERVVIGRDTTRGQEQHILITIRVDKPGVEEPLEGMEPLRVISVVDKGDLILYTGSTRDKMSLYTAGDGGIVRVADFQGIPVVNDYKDGLAVGSLFPPGKPGSSIIFLTDTRTGETRLYDPGEGSVYSPVYTRRYGLIHIYEGPDYAELRTLDPDTLESSRLELPYEDLSRFNPTSIPYIKETPDGSLVVIAGKRGRTRVFLDGRDVEAPPGTHGSAYTYNGRIILSHTSLSRPPRIIELDPASGEYRVLLEGSLPAWLPPALAESRLVDVKSFDGSTVPTYVLKSGLAGDGGPTVVLVHGGPFAEDSDAWDVFAASLASIGFNVVMPNYRGSTGYGEKWRLKIIGDPCGGELEDVASAAKWALESGLAGKIYVMGYSYGGYMTMCALTRKPGLFKAGVAGASIVDWVEMYGLSDAVFRGFIDLLFAGRRELMAERSPINHIDNIREPLCIIHPQNDTRTPLKPILKFMEKALEKGKSFEAHIAPDMGHTVTTMDDAVKILLPALLFLARIEAKEEHQP